MNSTDDRTLGGIVRGLTEDFSTLFRSEIALAKLEVKETVAKLSGGVGLLAGALFCVLFGAAFLLVTLILVLALWMPAWAAALVVAVVLFLLGGILAMSGKKKFSAIAFVPTETINSIKGDVDSIKSDIARVRSRQ